MMPDEIALMAKLMSARVAIDAARRNVAQLLGGSADHVCAQILLLQAQLHHTNLMVVLQAAQQARMGEEITTLQAELSWRQLN
jgi:hypothetical protein